MHGRQVSLFTLSVPSESLEAPPNRSSMEMACEGRVGDAIGLGLPMTIVDVDFLGEGAPETVADLRREDDREEDRAANNESSASSDEPCT